MQSFYQFFRILAATTVVGLLPYVAFGQGAPDCAAAIVLCSNASISFNPQGIGAVNDFAPAANSQGCLATGERNTAWYYFEFNNSMPPNSVITFEIIPNGSADYDFAIYGPGAGCNGLGGPVRCSYAGTFAATGLGNGATDVSEGAGGDAFVAPLTVQPGQGFYMVIDNFSSNNTSFNLSWGGSAAPFLDCNATPPCNVAVNYSPNYNVCAGGAPVTLQGTINGGDGTQVITWSAINGGGPYLSSPFVANPTVTIPAGVSGSFQYMITVDQGGCTDMATVTVNASAIPMPDITGDDQICQGESAILFATPGFVSYRWSPSGTGSSLTVSAGGTYTVTVTNSAGCQGTASFTVNQLPSPIPNITGPARMCVGGAELLNAGPGFDTYQWNTGGNLQQEVITAPGTYRVTVTQNGCQGMGQITVLPAPNLVVTPFGDNTICPGQSVNIDAGGGYVSYQWSNGSPEQINTVSGPGTYSVTVQDADGCSGSGSFTVSPAISPTPVITGNLSVCPGNSTTLDVANAGYTSYLWSDGSNSSLLMVNTPGAYGVTVTNAEGCAGSASVNVTAAPGPMPAISGDAEICPGETTQLSATGGFAAYQWSNAGAGPTTQVSLGGAYTVTVTDAQGCTGQASVNVIEHPAPAPVINGPPEICENGSGILDAGAGFSTYLWSTGAGGQTLTADAQATYGVTVTNQFGCVGTDDFFVGELPPPVPQISGDASFCEGSATTLTAEAGFSSYAWPDGSSSPQLTVSQSGTYTVTVTSGLGCTGQNSFTVSATPVPAPVITGDTEFCPGESASLQGPAGFAAYAWSDNNTTQDIAVSSPGAYSLTVTDANGCQGVATTVVNQSPVPEPVISGALEFCEGSSTNLSAGAGYSSYLWSTNASASGIAVNTAGAYGVTVTNDAGCEGSASVSVVQNSNPAPVIQGEEDICPGESTALTLSASYQSYEWSTGGNQASETAPGAGDYSVTVTGLNGCEGTATFTVREFNAPQLPAGVAVEYCQGDTATLAAPAGFAAYQWEGGGSLSNISVTTPGAYAYTVTDANGCTGTSSIQAVENPLPGFEISGEAEYCEGAATSLQAPSGYSSYQWSTGSTGAAATISAPGLVSVTVTDGNGCSDTRTLDVVEHPLPVANINGLLRFCTDGSTTLSGDGGFAAYSWSNGSSQPSISVSQAGNYSLTVTDANGCSDDIAVAVTEIPELTPAIDGETDFCAGASTVLQAEAGFQSYSWSTGASGASVTVTQAGTISLTVVDNNGCQGTASVLLSELPLPEPVISGSDFFCEGSSTTIDAGSGYAAYAWTGNASGQALTVSQAGLYTVTVTDGNGCQGTGAITVDEIPSPTPQISGALNFCPEGSTELSTGSNFAAYLWSSGSTNAFTEVSQPGSYGLTVTDAFGCQGSTAVDVAHFAVSPPEINGNPNYCPGGNTSLNGEGGFAAYLWSTGQVSGAITVNADGAYGLTVTDANGCQTASEILVTAYAVSPPQISGDNAFCAGGSASLQANAGFSAYNWSTGASQPAITVSSGGVYSLTVTDANGCRTNNSFAVTQNPLPTVNIGGSTSYCIGGFTTLNAGAQYAQYQWSTGGAASTIQVNQAGAYGLTVTDANGCVGSAQVQVTEDTELNPVVSGPLSFCPGTSTTLDAGEGFQTYRWSDNSVSQTLTVSNPGTYSVTVTDASGCTGDTDVAVSEYPAPMPVIEGALEYCAGSSTSLTAGGGAFSSYNWSAGSFEPQLTVGQPGVYSITVIDGNGCQETASATVQENPLPVFQISGALSFCQGGGTELSAPAGFASYLWSTGAQGPGITVQSPGNYGLTVTNSFGCSSQQAVSAAQVPLPLADAGPPQVIDCNEAAVQIGGTGSSQGGSVMYQWSGPGIDASNANAQFPSVSVPGEYILTAINTNLGCTSLPSSVLVSNDIETPIVVLEVQGVLNCLNSSVLVNAAGSSVGPGFTHQWFDGGMNPLSNPGLALQAGTAGTYYLQVSNMNNGCEALGSAVVSQNISYPLAEAGLPMHLDCETTAVTLDAAASQAGDSLAYNWTTVGGRILSGGNSLAPAVDEPGLYILTVSNTGNGCASADTVQVTQDINVPLAEAGPDRQIDCVNPVVTLNGAGSSTGSQYSHQWAFGQPGNVVGSGLSLTAEEAGAYFIIVTNTTNGCANTDAVEVIQNAAAPSDINLALDGPTCFGDADGSVLIGSVAGGTPPYLFSFDGQPFGGQTAFFNLPAGNYPVVVQDAIGCEYELVAALEDGNDLTVNLGEDRTVRLGEETALLAQLSVSESEIVALNWNAADSLSCTDCLRPVVVPSTSGSYFVEVVDENGCVASDQVILFVDKRRDLYVPNVFSPNGDGQNDVFMAFAGPEVARIRSFLVFNRWGESVFEVYNFPPNNPTYGWNGDFRSDLYNGAVFTWFAEVEFVDGVVEVFKGDVTLMR